VQHRGAHVPLDPRDLGDGAEATTEGGDLRALLREDPLVLSDPLTLGLDDSGLALDRGGLGVDDALLSGERFESWATHLLFSFDGSGLFTH
jgi:hypothetical protein